MAEIRKYANVVGAIRLISHRKSIVVRLFKKYKTRAPYYLLGLGIGKIRNMRLDRARREVFRDCNSAELLSSIPVKSFDSNDQQSIVGFINSLETDILFNISVSYVPKVLLNIVPGGVWGFHHGVIPLIRGLSSPFWAAYCNRPEWYGITLQQLSDAYDRGRIIAVKRPVPPYSASLTDLYITLDKAAVECIGEAFIRYSKDGVHCEVTKTESEYKSMPGLIPQILFNWKLKKFNTNISEK